MPSSPEEYNSVQLYWDKNQKNSLNSLSLNTSANSNALELTISSTTIDAWQYFLAAYLVSQWRCIPTEDWTLATIFQELNPSLTRNNSALLDALVKSNAGSGSFLDGFSTKFEEIELKQVKTFSNHEVLKWLVPATANLTSYLTKSISSYQKQLEINLENLRPLLHQKLHIYFYILKSAGTKTAFMRLNILSEKLHSLAKKYEWQWQECLYKSNASQQSFENLSAQLSRLWEFSKQQKAESALHALHLTYQYQLSGQLYNVATGLIRELETQVQQHILILTEIDLYLNQLQSKYAQQYPLSPLKADFLKHYLFPRINAVEFLEKIEQWIGRSFYEWVNLDEIESLRLKQEILIRLQPVCWDFYNECSLVEPKLNSSDFNDLER